MLLGWMAISVELKKNWRIIKGNTSQLTFWFYFHSHFDNTLRTKMRRRKVEVEMRGGSWRDHREPFRQNFAAVCRSTQKLFHRGRTIFGRFPHLEIWVGMQNFAVRQRAMSASIFLQHFCFQLNSSLQLVALHSHQISIALHFVLEVVRHCSVRNSTSVDCR